MRTPSSYPVWESELQHCKGLDPKQPGRDFNYDPEVFATYCNMQANFCQGDGFPLIAGEFRQIRDVAFPTFRSMIRELGGTVIGDVALWRGTEDIHPKLIA